MTIEQTKWFKEDVAHFVTLAKERMYLVGWDEEKANYLTRYINLRGADVTLKVCAKANQKLHRKVW